jgi:hypothetical protein
MSAAEYLTSPVHSTYAQECTNKVPLAISELFLDTEYGMKDLRADVKRIKDAIKSIKPAY